MSDGGLKELADWAQDHIEELVDAACDGILGRIPRYGETDSLSPAELRVFVGENMKRVSAAIGHPHDPLDLSVTIETGRRRAQQGIPLPEVHQAFRISFRTLWETLVDHVMIEMPSAADSLLGAANHLWHFSDEHAMALTEAYRAAAAEMLLAQQSRRGALVEALLSGQYGTDVSPWEAAALLGFPPDVEFVVVTAETLGLAEESLPDIEQRLAALGIVSGWRLTPAFQVGVVTTTLAQHALLLQTLRDTMTTRVGVSSRYARAADTPRGLQLARAALATLPRGSIDVREFESSPLAAAMACQPDEGARLAEQVLGPVLALPPADREPLLETLHTFLEHDGSAQQASVVLHCHPNTVRYRLRRVQDLTKRSLSSPQGLAEIATAAYAVRVGVAGLAPPVS